jgi:hypothetical protein
MQRLFERTQCHADPVGAHLSVLLQAGLFVVRAPVCYARTTQPILRLGIDEVLQKLCINDEI